MSVLDSSRSELPRSVVLSSLCLIVTCGWFTPNLVALPSCTSVPVVERLYDSYNRDATSNNPSTYPTFDTSLPWCILQINTYHWNDGVGQDPLAVNGFLGIYDLGSGQFVIKEAATALPPPFSYDDWNWVIYPSEVLPPGTYKIVDSDPATWSYSTTDYFHRPGDGPNWQPYQGFAQIYGYPIPEPKSLGLLGSGVILYCIKRWNEV